MAEVTGSGRYLFAVARRISPDALAGRSGIDGAALEIVEESGLQGVVCSVPLAEFGEQPLRENLEDLTWLEKVARAHNDVVVAVASAGTVAPMRLVTICSDDDSVRRRIGEAHEDLVAALDRVEGRREWSVKVYALPVPDESTPPPAATGPGSGAAYLQRKREEAARRRNAGERTMAVADEIHDGLAGCVVASVRLAPQDPRLTGRTETMILNGAYLVTAEEGDGFRDLVRRVGEGYPEAVVEVEGPWPPYSFATLE